MWKKNKVLPRILSLSLVGVMIVTAGSSSYAASVSKSETVYVKLTADGSPKDVIVTDWLRGDDFTRKFMDKTNLSGINNVKSDLRPIHQSDSLMWDTRGQDVYYQGTSNRQVPIGVEISYLLNDKPLAPEEIAGKSGKITLNLKLKNNSSEAIRLPSVGGTAQIAAPFTAVAVLALPTDTFRNVQVDNAKIFSDGNSQFVVFIGFPGLTESLNLPGSSLEEFRDLDIPQTMSLTADATDFEMAPIAIATSPNLPDLLRDIRRPDELSALGDDLDRMLAAKEVVDATDPGKTMESLYKDPEKTKAAQLLMDDIFDFYDLDKALLDILPDYTTDENISLYDRIHDHLKEAGLSKILDNQVLKFIPDRLTDENIRKSRVLMADYDQLKTFRTEKLDQLIEIMDDYDNMKSSIDTGSSVLDKMEAHQTELDNLDQFSKHSRKMLDLLTNLQSSGLETALTDADIQVMINALAEHKTKEFSSKFDNLLSGTGEVLNRDMLLFIINKAKQSGKISEEQATPLVALVNSGNVGPIGTPAHDSLLAMIEGAKAAVGSSVTSEIGNVQYEAQDLLNQIREVQTDLQNDLGYDYLYKLYNIVDFMDEVLPEVRYLRDRKDKDQEALDRLQDLITNEEDMEYFQDWTYRLKDMKEHLDENEENIEVLRDLLDQYNHAEVRHFKENIPILREDMEEARPILKSLADKLDEPVYYDSLHKAPETVNTLVRMKNDLETHRNIIDILSLALDPRNVTAARDIIEIMDRRDGAGDLEKARDKADSLEELFDRKQAIQQISDDYNIFTEKNPEMDSDVKFVLQTEEIKKPEMKKAYVPKKQEKVGFFTWVKQKVSGIF